MQTKFYNNLSTLLTPFQFQLRLFAFFLVMIVSVQIEAQECGSPVKSIKALEHHESISQDLKSFTQDFIKNENAGEKMPPIDIPYRIHIVRQDNGSGGVDYGDVMAEMALVNTRYAPDLTFTECGAPNYINSSQFYFLSGDAEGDLMSTTHNSANVLNIFFVGNAAGFCGWARFTFLLPSDYIVIDNSCATNSSTLAHEIGHYFDLFHTHETAFGDECVDGSNCGTAGDLICDTPADPVLTGKVNGACAYTGADLDPCNNDPYAPDPTNIMSYSTKPCRTFFSVEQRAKVVFTAQNGRSYLAFNCPPTNDDVCNATPIILGVPTNANSTNATAQIGEVNPGVGTDGSDGCNATDGWCNYPGNGEPGIQNSLWFSFIAPASGYIEILTDNIDDTQLAVWSVGDCANFGSFVEVVANDDSGPGFAPHINCTTVVPGQTYYLQIDGFDGQPYNTNIIINELGGPPANDDCINAEPISCGNTVFGNTSVGCVNTETLGFCGTTDGTGGGLWYTWTGDGTRVTLTTCNPGTDYDTKIRVWSGSCGALNCVEGNDDNFSCGFNTLFSRVQFCSTPGEQYFILVHGFSSNEGNFELSMTCDMELEITCPPDITVTCADPTDPGFTGSATGNTNLCCPNAPTISHIDVTDYNNFTITRTWKATWDCGLELSCDQVITIYPALFYFGSTSTPESCGGAGDGSIVIDAISQGGQLAYSIDGGVNYQFSNTFPNLTAGSYNVKVKLFGIPEVCEEIDDVQVLAGPTPTVWYKDFDSDGYSDGNTLSSCTQPPGYIASPGPGTDCNDSNSNIYPGAPELCDGLDNDCDGVIPGSETDDDGDGMADCAGDCDDTNATVYTGAPELCDGLDNDCNGFVDDGVPTTYVGSVTFYTQADVDAWPACYTTIDGNVTIMGAGINNLGPLSNVTTINGMLFIYGTGLSSLAGLENLVSVGAGLSIYYNFSLSDCCAIYNLLNNNGVTGAITIFFNAVGCNSQGEILSNCAPMPIVGGNQNGEIAWDANTLQDLALFPNPATHEVNVLINRTAPSATLKVMDMLGRIVYSQVLEEGVERVSIDLRNGQFGNGIYLVTLIENGEMLTKQLIIQQ